MAPAGVLALLIVTGLRVPVDQSIKPIALLLAAYAIWAAVQIVPLPPSLWASLPGHGKLAAAMNHAGLPLAWQPISLAPDETLAALIGLAVPASILLAVPNFGQRQQHILLYAILLVLAVSIVLGVGQMGSAADSAFYLYRQGHTGYASGLFANRNHQAVILAASLPFVRVAAEIKFAGHRNTRSIVIGIFAMSGAVVAFIIFATGSRAGLVALPFGLLFAAILSPLLDRTRLSSWSGLAISCAAGFVLTIAVFVFFYFNRFTAVQRITDLDIIDDMRFRFLPIMKNMLDDFVYTGSGLGSFDRVFRLYEPDWALKPTFFNRAHNDLLEVAITGGIPGLTIVLAAMAWLLLSGRRILKQSRTLDDNLMLSRAGLAFLSIVLPASLIDYPLRAPLGLLFAAVAASWLALGWKRAGILAVDARARPA